MSSGTKIFSCFFSQTGMSFGSNVFMKRETDGVGVSFGNVGGTVEGISLGLVMLMCLINILFFSLMAFYLD